MALKQGARDDYALERLDGLAGLLANRDDIGGVETRDPASIAEGPDFVAVERPELVIYTTPVNRGAVVRATEELAQAIALEVVLDAHDHSGDDWRDAWKRHYRSLYFRSGPTADARRLMIRPSWIPREADDPSCELILDPGRAFGTGLHESTSLCLQALVEIAAREPAAQIPRRVLDLGCGSGILGLASLKIWPEIERLTLADHDPEAVATARENAEANALADRAGLEFRELSLSAQAAAIGPAELVFANIRPKVLIPAAPTIVAALAPGGTVLLSGILDEEGDEVLAAYAELELLARVSEEGWCALVMRRPDDGPETAV
ncbi:50S ribosomal protein L11 methyltransferase [Enhygromyxa salina]|uniref:50S ribosomal protein L11 methyltransferase n=1 Tax=Enhygromyxa salina TaxID=215803 RepID=UPI0015E618AF|nr:50S ribosomal protein L11 methyltransferase [Enhygromyxa salina]